jgi:hypothetical protein
LVILISEYIAYASLHHAEIIKSKNIEIVLMTIGIILPIIFIASMLYSYRNYSVFNSLINTISSVWLVFILYTFIASLFVFSLIMLNTYLGFQIPIKIISSLLILIIISLITYGVINSNNTKVVRWSIISEKLYPDWGGKKIIIISDIHLGSVRGEKFLQKIITKIDKENPDVVFILGDLIDGPAFPYEKWLNEFSKLKPQMGILYVEGNHEKYNFEYEKFKSLIPNSINNLTDKKIILNNTQIIGLDYDENENKIEIENKLKSLDYKSSESSIILIHDPKNIPFLSDFETSLTLSGHTHAGQFFPFNSLVNFMYKKYTHGVSYTNKTASLVSSGVGSSLIPVRIGTSSEIIILDIVSK